jgi:replicative DNA helicase
MGQADLLNFADRIGAVGAYKEEALAECRAYLLGRDANTNRDIIPSTIWREYAVPAMQRNGISLRRMQSGLGMAHMGTTLYRQNVSRERMSRLVRAVGGETYLQALATSDVYWDRILAIEPDGEEEVFDLTVPGPANFVANDIIVHNSLEQDSDVVMLLHRPELYEPGEKEGVVEIIIGKQRNGPTGTVTLTYQKQFMAFEDFSVDTGFTM